MEDSDTEMGFDPATLLQMDMNDAGTDYTGGLEVTDFEIGNESDTANNSDQQTPTKNDDDSVKLKSFEDEKQFIALMELANGVQREEMEARSKHFDLPKTNYYYIIARSYSHCTMCNVHIPVNFSKGEVFKGHPILKTLVCRKCYKFYGDGNFDRGEDGVDLYCRWCAEGGLLFCCSSCPNVFCKSCVKRNFGLQETKKIDEASSWNCYVCEPKKLWGFRGMYATISQMLMEFKSNGSLSVLPEERSIDLTCCCSYQNDLKKFIKSQSKVMTPYIPGVYIPQVKPKPRKAPIAPPIPIKNRILLPQQPIQDEYTGNAVNDFFSNGHFLEAALPPLPPPPKPTPLPPTTNTGFIVVRQPAPRTQLIRPKNLSVLQAKPQQRVSAPPPLVRTQSPAILRPPNPGQYTPRRPYTPNSQMRIRGPPNTTRTGQTSYVMRTPHISTSNILVRKTPSPASVSSPSNLTAPTPEWFDNMLDQALLSADFYKDEIIKLKLSNMTLHRKQNTNMRSDPSVLSTVRTLNWIMKSMLEQGLDIRRAIAKQYPKTESSQESLNMERLHKMKGAPYATPTPPVSKTVSYTAPISKQPSSGSAVTKTVVAVSHHRMNGTKNSNDVVDLVSDDEDSEAQVMPRTHSQLTISPVKRFSLPIMPRAPLTPTPSNRLAIPVTRMSPASRKRKKKKKMDGDSDDSEDGDYIPSASPSTAKKRRKSMSTSPSASKLMVTNVRSLQEDKSSAPPKPQPQKNSYLNQVSEDVIAQVMHLNNGGSDSSDIEEIDPDPSKDPFEEDEKDDWITQNPTAYEKYCIQYDLVKDWYIAVKTMDTSERKP